GLEAALATNRAFANWHKRNVHPHKKAGYSAVTLSLKKTGVPPGDVTVEQMEKIADLADRYSFGELRVSHEQNLIFADVQLSDLYSLWQEVKELGFATPNVGLLTGIGAALARARVPDVSEKLIDSYLARRDSDAERFLDVVHRIGVEPFKESGYGHADQRAAHRRGQLAPA